ncbi:MAG: type III pantothenate kinase, partial [Clostridia bacterium]|nr:type III pantothenate kinase [Clostridia bacterium]
MILTLDIGNTNIKTALFEHSELKQYWRISTNRTQTSDEYGMVMLNLFNHAGVSPSQVSGIIVSSVVPTINFTIEHMCKTYFGLTPM